MLVNIEAPTASSFAPSCKHGRPLHGSGVRLRSLWLGVEGELMPLILAACSASLHVCMYMYIYVCMYICIYIHTYMYIHAHICNIHLHLCIYVHIISYHIISYHIMSYHVISSCGLWPRRLQHGTNRNGGAWSAYVPARAFLSAPSVLTGMLYSAATLAASKSWRCFHLEVLFTPSSSGIGPFAWKAWTPGRSWALAEAKHSDFKQLGAFERQEFGADSNGGAQVWADCFPMVATPPPVGRPRLVVAWLSQVACARLWCCPCGFPFPPAGQRLNTSNLS